MNTYHKIYTVFKRDPSNKFKLLTNNFYLPEFEYLKNNIWEFTEKVDGTNIRIILDSDKKDLIFKGKTDRAEIPKHLLSFLKENFKFEHFQKVFNKSDISICLYGEGYGPKIQKVGGLYRKDPSFVLFDILINDWWIQRKDVINIGKLLNIDVVPIIGKGNLFQMVDLVKKGFKSTWGDFTAEGIVARPEIELKCRNGNRIITKLKHKDF